MYTTLTIALLNNAIHSKVDSLAQKCPSSELVDKQFFWQTASHFKGMKAAVDVDAGPSARPPPTARVGNALSVGTGARTRTVALRDPCV